ncbi:MAG: c-type cytochrome [Candidatus Korobacteraceae bacterium]
MKTKGKQFAPPGNHLFFLATAVLAVTFAGVMASGNAKPAQSPASNAAPAVQTAVQKYKNIQVLKDIPADQLIPSMQFITAALGVECDFCHVANPAGRLEFEKDDKKEKKTAREMMQMMFAIDKNNFEGERQVTCNTCHRGSPHPQAIPAVPAETAKPEAMGAMHEHDMNPESLPPGAPVVAKFIQAIGGEAALDKVSARVEKGAAIVPEGPPVPIDIYTKAPDERVSVMHTPKGDSVTAYNGQAGWIAFPGRPLREMSAPDQQAAKLDAEAFYPNQLAHEFTELKLQDHPEKVGERQADVVLGLTKGQPPVKLYFDKDSGLLLRMVHHADTPLGLNPTQVDFADYRVVSGVKTPFRWTIARPSGSFTIQIEKVEQNVPVDDAKFVEPKPEPPPPPKQ